MKSRYTWLDLVSLDSGALPFVETRYGNPYTLESAELVNLPSALRESLQDDGFDLKRGIVVSRDTRVIDGFVFKQ